MYRKDCIINSLMVILGLPSNDARHKLYGGCSPSLYEYVSIRSCTCSLFSCRCSKLLQLSLRPSLFCRSTLYLVNSHSFHPNFAPVPPVASSSEIIQISFVVQFFVLLVDMPNIVFMNRVVPLCIHVFLLLLVEIL